MYAQTDGGRLNVRLFWREIDYQERAAAAAAAAATRQRLDVSSIVAIRAVTKDIQSYGGLITSDSVGGNEAEVRTTTQACARRFGSAACDPVSASDWKLAATFWLARKGH
jgi:hypothetical protein